MSALERLFYHGRRDDANICSLERSSATGPLAVTAIRMLGGMASPRFPLDGEHLFVAHWWSERTFASNPRRDEEPMVAVSCPRSTSVRAPRSSVCSPVPSPPSEAVRRRRAAAVLVALAALGVLLGAGSLAGAGQDGSGPSAGAMSRSARPIAARVHVVQPGDTLWSLARLLQPVGDVRPLVARLQAEHGSGPLVPGERLRLGV
jgi:hypothetical protein